MLSAFTLKIHIKSPSKIQTRSQTCKQFEKKKKVAMTITEYRCNVDVKKKKSLATGQNFLFLLEYSLFFPILELAAKLDLRVYVWQRERGRQRGEGKEGKRRRKSRTEGERDRGEGREYYQCHLKSLVANWFYDFSMGFGFKAGHVDGGSTCSASKITIASSSCKHGWIFASRG